MLVSIPNDAPQGCKPALGQERGTSFARRLAAKSATCPFPVAKHCCKWFLLTCRIYVSSLMLLNCACELLPREPKGAEGSQREPKGAEGSRREPNAGYWMPSKKQVQLVLPGNFIFPVEGCKQENSQLAATSAETGRNTRESQHLQRLGDTGRQVAAPGI